MKWRFLVLFLILLTSAFLCFGGKKKRELLITGCARSGTTYMTKVLKECGMRIGHETFRKDGVSSWKMAVDTKKVPSGHGRNGCRFRHVFHQVRHPLKVITSVYFTEPPQSWAFIMQHIPEIQESDPHLVKCAKYWYFWNLKVEGQAEWRYRIEGVEEIWPEMERRLSRKLDKTVLARTLKNVNSHGSHPEFTWEDLKQQLDPELYRQIQTLAQKYGYSD